MANRGTLNPLAFYQSNLCVYPLIKLKIFKSIELMILFFIIMEVSNELCILVNKLFAFTKHHAFSTLNR